MSVIHAPGKPRPGVRLLLIPAVVLVLFGLLLVRFWYVQVAIAPSLREKAEVSGTIRERFPAPRGIVFDRKGKLIAGVQNQLVLMAKPSIVLKKAWVLDKVAALLAENGISNSAAERLKKKTSDGIFRPDAETAIFAGLPMPVAAKIVESSENFPGLTVRTRPIRSYPDPLSFSHLLGYVWVPGRDDIQRAKAAGREVAEMVGKGGLEYQYEELLMGTEGVQSFQRDGHGRKGMVVDQEPAIPGTQLVLGIDAEVQRAAVAALSGHRGAVVALEPSSGEILCLASRPTYDLELFRNGISQEDFDLLNNSPEHPFINRATNSAFSPGSTFKIVTTVAAMKAGVFDPNRTVLCSGGYRLGKQFFKCLGHHGTITFKKAFEKSCNTYFADLAMRVGKDQLRETALEMGFYAKTGVDLPSERSGLIPTDDWLERVNKKWVPGFTVLTGIGQGDVLATPMQMANLAAMVANGGTTFKPHLVRSSRGEQEEIVSPKISQSVNLDTSSWGLIQEAMVGVIEEGTAAGSRIAGMQWAGKTGSAEVYGQSKTNSWFIGYAPAVNPKIAICVMVEAVGHGSDFAAPVARRVVESYLKPASVSLNSSSAR